MVDNGCAVIMFFLVHSTLTTVQYQYHLKYRVDTAAAADVMFSRGSILL